MIIYNNGNSNWWCNFNHKIGNNKFLHIRPPLYIALIRPNHWAASVAQWLEHLPSKQCVVGSNPTRAALFSFRRKKSCLG